MHLGETSKVAIVEGMMNSLSSVLDLAIWSSNDMDDRRSLGVCAGYRIDGRELSDSECGDQSTEALNARVAICSVAGI
jgi:hypothetical protein